jgi:hypothetical protein
MSESHGQHGHAPGSADEFDHWLFRIVVIAAVLAYASHGLAI